MLEEFQEQQRKRTARMRSVMDYVRGIIFLAVGVFFLIYGQLGISIRGRAHSSIDYVIGGLFVLYGIWRMYRGYKKDYFNDSV